MKTLYLILGVCILLAVLLGCPAVQFSALGAAFGWLAFEQRRTKRI